MIEEINKFKNENEITLLPINNYSIYDSIEYTLHNVILIDNVDDDLKIVDKINSSKIRKIYLIGDKPIYKYILPRLSKKIEVCWIFIDSLSNLSDFVTRYILQVIYDYYDRGLVKYIGCISKDTEKVFTNAGFKCEFIDLKIKKRKNILKNNNKTSIGVLSNDADPRNNFYNQLASLKFVNYDICKIKSSMKSTDYFSRYFNIRTKKMDSIEEVIKDNFVNLYVNFTNTNNELIYKSYNYGVPVIVGNTNFYRNNKFLTENLVVKSDDDINEIAEKIMFVKDNYKKIMEEYNKID